MGIARLHEGGADSDSRKNFSVSARDDSLVIEEFFIEDCGGVQALR